MSKLQKIICRSCCAYIEIAEGQNSCRCRFCGTMFLLKRGIVRSRDKKMMRVMCMKALVCGQCGARNVLSLDEGERSYTCRLCDAKNLIKDATVRYGKKAVRTIKTKKLMCKYCGSSELRLSENNTVYKCLNCGAIEQVK